MSLPAGVTTGVVTGTFATLVAGASVPVDGMLVVFKPSAPVVLDAGASQTLAVSPVTGVVRQGILYDTSGAVGVTLIATDSAGINPTGFTWQVTFLGAPPIGFTPFSFALPGGTTKDLATLSPVPPAPYTPSMLVSDSGVAGYVPAAGAVPFAPTNGPTGMALDARYGRLAPLPRARGVVCFTWDDGYPSWNTYIVPLANKLGQKHTFCVVTNRIDVAPFGMTSANIAAWYAAGHEIASHTVDHARMPDLTPTQLSAEYDNSKTALEAIVGVGNVRTFTYPYGTSGVPVARNQTTDDALLDRYDRVLDTVPLGRYPMHQRAPFLIARYGIGSPNGSTDIPALIRLAAVQPIIVVFYGHAVVEDGLVMDPSLLPANQPYLAQSQGAMQLAHDLGIPCLTVAEAFPRANLVVNGSFETGDTSAWTPQIPSSGLSEVITDTPDTGLQGTKSLHLKCVSDSTAAVAQKQWAPVEPGKAYVFSGRIRVVAGPADNTSWAARIKIEPQATYDLASVGTAINTVTPASGTYGTWQKVQTAPWVCPPGVSAVLLTAYVQQGALGQTPLPEAFFDHLYFDEAAHAVYGPTGTAWPALDLHAARHAAGGVDVLTPAAIGAGVPSDLQAFTTSGTWTKPSGSPKMVHVRVWAGGAGGGAGACAPSGTLATGGAGGGAGGYTDRWYKASDLSATVAVVVGAGGAGGVGVSATGPGGAGTGGGSSYFGANVSAYLGGANPGILGNGGTTTGAALGGAGGLGATGTGSAGGNSSATGGVGGNGAYVTNGPSGGGAGGGITTGVVAAAGSSGGGGVGSQAAGGAVNTVGGAGINFPLSGGGPGLGGGGGGASITGTAGAGGAGGAYGAGGGGGGASLNGFASGNGGAGAPGYVVVETYF